MMTGICEKIGISSENIKEIDEVIKKLLENNENQKDLEEAKNLIFTTEITIDGLCDFEVRNMYDRKNHPFMDSLDRIINRSGINKYTVYLAFLIYSICDLKDKYKEKGLSDELFYETMKDISYKIKECQDVYGVLGVEPILWYSLFYTCERFCLGRLQYERGKFKKSDYRGELEFGDVVIKFHIPSNGPLNEEVVIDSFKKAYEFYKDDIKNGRMYFTCASWLLYPRNIEIFPENSNLRKFFDMFDIISGSEQKDNPDFWRVFNMNYEEGILEKVPRDNTLRRNLYEFMKKGNSMGDGLGVIVFDGDKIVNR